jgi:1,4-dihydroxy-2-naphthoate polyprenyltransferase
VNPWVEAARPRTLVAGVVPVLVGTAAADRFSVDRFVAAVVVGIAIQIGVNYANDLFDFTKGVDRPDRAGPRRATATGLISPRGMKTGIGISLGVAALAGLYLAALVGPELIVVGALCFAAALGYSGGPKPYASSGLGEVFVFLFFGVIATAGSTYVQDERLTALSVVASIPVGLLATAILVVNNLRDISSDGRAGKNTLAVRIGRAGTKSLYSALVTGAFLLLALIAFVAPGAWPLLAALAAPAAARAVSLVRSRDDVAGLIAALGATARLQLLFGVLLASGLWLSR